MIYHMDMYRLSKQELAVFPLEDYLDQGLCLIEWADRVRDRLPAATQEIHLKITGLAQRTIKINEEISGYRDLKPALVARVGRRI